MSYSLKNNEQGFTILELVVALAISLVLMGIAVKIFLVQQRAYNVQEQLAEMQQNIRSAMDMIVRETKMAGYMVEGTDTITTQDVGTITFLSDIDSDIVTNIDTNPASAGEQSISVDLNDSDDTVSTTDYVYISDGSNTELISTGDPAFDTTGEPDTINLSTSLSNSYAVGSTVRTIEQITYDIDNTTDPDHPYLRRNSQPLAENIQELTLSYFDADGSPTTNSSAIRQIKISITGRTAKIDPDLKRVDGVGYRYGTLTTRVIPENLDF